MHAERQARVIASEQREAESVVEESVEEPLTEGELKVTDLSVPVESMNKNAELAAAQESSEPQKPRRKLKMPRVEKAETAE